MILQSRCKFSVKAALRRAVISQKMVISIGNGVLKANDPNTLSQFGGGITLTDNWARGVLKLGYTKRNHWKSQTFCLILS